MTPVASGSCRFGSLVLAAVLTTVLAACGGGRGSSGGSGGGLEEPEPQQPGPSQPAGQASCGAANVAGLARQVFVSEAGTDSAGCGSSTTATCRSIQQGIDNCAAGAAGCGVLVRFGLYPTTATIVLQDGVQVYGGCLFDGDEAMGYRSVVQAAPAPGTPAILADAISTPTLVSGLFVVGKDETVVSTASIAMLARSSSALTFAATTLAAGRGTSAPLPPPPPDGTRGNNGWPAGGKYVVGGGGGACPAGGTNVGGAGSTNPIYTDHRFFYALCSSAGGSVGQAGGAVGSVIGGAGGQPGGQGCMCWNSDGSIAGQPGDAPTATAGNPGVCAAAGGRATTDNVGSLDGQGAWGAPLPAGAGSSGGSGSGGGGGGGGGYTADGSSNSGDISGYAGGGGGGGGCGGGGGAPGPHGGASFALVVSGASPVLQGLTLIPGPGGVGGTGGNGGRGGGGGSGQSGWAWTGGDASACSGIHESGAGGHGADGGQGGAGSGGAAGNGGPSAAIAMAFGSPPPQPPAAMYAPLAGEAGQPGAGGSSPCQAAAGEPGQAGINQPIITLGRPTTGVLMPGQTLVAAQNESLLSPNGLTRFIAQTDGNVCIYVSGNYRWCSLQWLGVSGTQTVQMSAGGQLCLQTGTATSCYPASGAIAGSYLEVRDSGHVAVTNGVTDTWVVP